MTEGLRGATMSLVCRIWSEEESCSERKEGANVSGVCTETDLGRKALFVLY